MLAPGHEEPNRGVQHIQAVERPSSLESIESAPEQEPLTPETAEVSSQDWAPEEVLSRLLEERNTAFATGNSDLVTRYALESSQLASLDQESLTDTNLKTTDQKLMLDSITETKQENSETYRVTAIVRAEGANSGAETETTVYMQDGAPHQKVQFALQRTETGWLLTEAVPQQNK